MSSRNQTRHSNVVMTLSVVAQLCISVVTAVLLVKYRFSCDVTAAILVYSTIGQKVFCEFDSIVMKNLSDILLLYCAPTWWSPHVNENQE